MKKVDLYYIVLVYVQLNAASTRCTLPRLGMVRDMLLVTASSFWAHQRTLQTLSSHYMPRHIFS